MSEDVYCLKGQWYAWRNGRMVPVMGPDELAKREQLLAEMNQRQAQSRRAGLHVVTSTMTGNPFETRSVKKVGSR